MQAIKIDFCRTRQAPRWIAPVLMLLALAFTADVGVSFIQVHREVKKNEISLAKLDPRSYKPARNATAEEVAAARDTLARLSMPWDRLFGALESAANDQVALLAIQPDPKAGTVLISGDSKDYLAALTYVLNLSRTDALAAVQLARHEVKPDAKAVGFSISAQWGAK
ncbi:MAG TPA: PilN domain-containing protein [Burkholderiales bacterium]|nr:PilN domain-containing protein [Burkholderiales bacterium]